VTFLRPLYKPCLLAVLGMLLVLTSAPSMAQSELEGAGREDAVENNKPRGADGIEYGGVVTRAVISSLGELFYRRFSEVWSTQKDTANYLLTVRESNARKGNTEVLVLYQDDVLFRSMLPRNQQAVIGLSEAAVDAVYQRVVEISLQDLLYDDADMARVGL
jgi:Curli assembly protein CsgE